jgi:hypothetical protein
MLSLAAALLFAAAEEGAAGGPNRLTPQEVADGWVLLFDGETTSGWDVPNGSKWTVADGMLAPQAGKRGLLVTTKTFRQYELKLQYIFRLPDDPFQLPRPEGSPRLLLGCGADGELPRGKGDDYDLAGVLGIAPPLGTARPRPLFGRPDSGWIDLSLTVTEEGDRMVIEESFRGHDFQGSGNSTRGDRKSDGRIGLSGNGVVFRGIKLRPLRSPK